MVKSPPTTTHLLFGLVAIDQTAPLSFGAKPSGFPVVRLKAARYVRTASPRPAALPGWRMRVNSPPAYTVLPATPSALTLALVCQANCFTAESAEPKPG